MRIINASTARALTDLKSGRSGITISRIMRLIELAIKEGKYSIHITENLSARTKAELETENYNVNSSLDEFDRQYITISWR